MQTNSSSSARVSAAYTKYFNGLFRYGRLRSSEHDAQEAVQHAFLQLIAKEMYHETDGNMKSWLYRVCHNFVEDIHRRNARLGVYEATDLQSLAESAPAGKATAQQPFSPDVELMQREEEDEIGKALRNLPAKQEQALVLFYMEDFTYKEMAEIMGLEVHQISYLLGQARASLRRSLANVGISSPQEVA